MIQSQLATKRKDVHNTFLFTYLVESLTLSLETKWRFTVKLYSTLKIGTPKIITIIVLQMEQLDFTVQYCIQKMQTE